MNFNNNSELLKELGRVLTMQFDYPPNGEGSVGYKGNNLYRFKTSDIEAINALLEEKTNDYKHSYNIEVLAQEMITDLLDRGLIVYGGYDYKKQQKEHHSI